MENSNKCKLIPSLAAIAFCFGVSSTASAAIVLYDYGFNVDGSVAYPFDGDAIPSGIDISLFDEFTGLGTINVTINDAGTHYFGAVFDHEISEPGNSFFNESGSVSGNSAAGQSWEIDEPGAACVADPIGCRTGSDGFPYYGDIYANFEDGTLDNDIFFDAIDGQTLTPPDDVSMAMGWDFSLVDGETATIMLMLSTTMPTGFYLAHYDPGIPGSGPDATDPATIYLSSTLDISPIPVPAAVWLFGSALLGLVGFSRRKTRV